MNKPPPAPSSINTLQGQVGSLIGICHHLGGHLYESVDGHEMDPAAKRAARETFINACHRLDIMTKENYRWTDPTERGRPSVALRPTLSRLGDGWLCAYGDDPDTRLEGWGPTPAEAMNSFDTAYEN